MPPGKEDLMQRIYELERDNNRMLHAMRRNSFIGGMLRMVLWLAAIGLPIWLYVQYLGPVLNQAMGTINQVQGQVQAAQDLGASITVPFSQFSGILDGLKPYLPEGTFENMPR